MSIASPTSRPTSGWGAAVAGTEIGCEGTCSGVEEGSHAAPGPTVSERAAMSAAVVGGSSGSSVLRMMARLSRIDVAVEGQVQIQTKVKKKAVLTEYLFDECCKWFQESGLERWMGGSKSEPEVVFPTVVSGGEG